MKKKHFEIRMMDEMEMAINLKAMRYAYGFIIISLMFYCIYGFITTGELRSIPFLIMVLSNVIHTVSRMYMEKKMALETEDEE